jgi:predicted AlkP superfamily pyrophosphatase or phosphodiesterase
MLYFSDPDPAGHDFGPAAAETRDAVRHVDRMLAHLVDGVAARGLAGVTNWIVVSDHGMTATSPGRVIVLEELVDFDDIAEIDANAVGLIEPASGREAALLAALATAHSHLHAAHRDALPERFHFRAHRRIPPLVVWVDPGWTLFARRPESGVARLAAGNHGYDPDFTDMHGIFVAHGPAFRDGVTAPPLANVHLYELFCALLGVVPAANDGDRAATRWALETE